MRWIVVALCSVTAPAAAQAPANLPPQRQALWNEVRALADSMEAAVGRGDMLAVSRFYADDARMAGGGGPLVAGRAAMDRYWTRIREPRSWRLDIRDVGGSAELAYWIGTSHLVTGPVGRERTSTTNFVVVLARQPGGGLRITLDLY